MEEVMEEQEYAEEYNDYYDEEEGMEWIKRVGRTLPKIISIILRD